MKTLRSRRKNRSKTRKFKGGLFGFLNGPIQGINSHASALANPSAISNRPVVASYGSPGGPLAPGTSMTQTTFSLMPGVSYQGTTNAYGTTKRGLTGVIPGTIGAAEIAYKLANPTAQQLKNGRFGLQGNISNFSRYPNPYRDLAVSTKASNAQIKAAYSNKIQTTANNASRKVLNAAYATLSDPARRAKYDANAQVFFASHPPTPGNVVAMMKSQGQPHMKEMQEGWKAFGL